MSNCPPPITEPLSPTQRDIVADSIEEETPFTQYGVLGGLYTGLTAVELVHLVPSMIQSTEQGLNIRLPTRSVNCRSATGRPGPGVLWRMSGTEDTQSGCGVCSGSYQFRTPRVIPVRDDRVISLIQRLFSLYNGLPASATLNERVEAFGERYGIDRLSSGVLRNTFPVILAEKGFTRSQIGVVMGWSEKTVDSLNATEKIGQFCAGGNPFVCGAETASGSNCQQYSVGRNEYCEFHSEDKSVCGAEREDGELCQKIVSRSGDQCFYHQDNPICGAKKSRTEERCQRRVDHPDDQCVFHQD